MACEPADIASPAECFTCLPEKMLQGMMVYLLGQLLKQGDSMADCSPQALAAASNCYTSCLSGKGLLGAAVYLLCELVSGGEGPGSTTIIRSGHGAPDTPGGTIDGVYINIDCTALWFWTASTLTWTEMDIGKATGNYVVPTVVEVRQLDTSTCPPIKVETFGRDVVGDDQASVYRWDPDSLDADTGMSVLMPNDKDALTPGRWIQVVFA